VKNKNRSGIENKGGGGWEWGREEESGSGGKTLSDLRLYQKHSF